MKVLLIEDEPAVAGIIKKGLAENGYSITVAPDGNIGCDLALQHVFFHRRVFQDIAFVSL